ncbi:hypothetical protein D8Y22_07870 [Salinadaptatus halalkaliphilus]|uniref:Uncharacterized protein n=1 Tax=Salinadaptatus halalkaliphilus TaxID=2419781 RepID=A0A4S3TLR3_9EURY|nr:DUF5810 domain-containing protein [Salinadaptatus halalkaliphilus]THE65131.1 hypothetical protein D8Y22_07870 [Salinadaptatus halalkaliphilus]
MGYACPVCGSEQADAVHLANHLAVTASLGREDHLEWLDEHVPNWDEQTPEELGELVSEHASEIDTPDFDEGPAHDHGRPAGLEDDLARQTRQPGRSDLSAGAEGVLEEARELTQQMYADADSEDGDVDGTSSDPAGARDAEAAADESPNENA